MNDKSKLILGASAAVAALGVLFLTKDTTPPGMGKLSGRVTDSVTGVGLAGVTVSMGGISVTTSSQGQFEILNIDPGEYLVTFSKSGYEEASY